MLNIQSLTGRLETIRGKATAAVGQHMGDAERKGRDGLLKKRRRAGLGFLVIDGQVDGARGAVDRDIEIAFAPLAVGGLELSPTAPANR
jgi:hypothetical protein